MRFNIYCDESTPKGRFYSRFYGGALAPENKRLLIEDRLLLKKEDTRLNGELKWVKVNAYNLEDYRFVVDEFFNLLHSGFIKMRVMFLQNIHQIAHLDYKADEAYLKLYYQFVKHAFGLQYCNPAAEEEISIAIFLDEVPESKEKFLEFKRHLAKLSNNPDFIRNRVHIREPDIAGVNSKCHIILQMVDIILGSMQFRLNDLHKQKPEGSRKRGKKTIAKERLYKHILSRIREGYPNFNPGVGTGYIAYSDRWTHPYRHWSFKPKNGQIDLGRAKKEMVKKHAPRSV